MKCAFQIALLAENVEGEVLRIDLGIFAIGTDCGNRCVELCGKFRVTLAQRNGDAVIIADG